MRKFFKLFFLSLLLGFSILSFSKQVFVVGTENVRYYPLYEMRGNEYIGISADILRAFAKSKGYTFKFKGYPVKRLFQNFASGELDFKYPDHPYWGGDFKKGKNVTYSDPAVPYIDGVFVTPGNKGKGIDHLKILGTVMGFTAWDYLGHVKDGKVKISENPLYTGLLQQVMKGQINGAYVNVDVTKYTLRTTINNPGALVFDPDLPHTSSAYHLSTISHPEIIKEFNEFLKNNTALIKSLRKKYQLN